MRSEVKRILLLICGWVSFILGVIGVVLPVLPTTPFMILAAACFSRSSVRFHEWLLNNRFFGQVIRDWEKHKSVTRVVKVRALIIIVATFSISILVVPKLWLKVMLVGFGVTCFYFIYRLPELSDSHSLPDNLE